MLNLMVDIFVFFCRRMLVRTRSRRGSCRPGVSKQVRYEGFWKVWAKWHLCRKTECQCYILSLRNIKTSIASKPIVSHFTTVPLETIGLLLKLAGSRLKLKCNLQTSNVFCNMSLYHSISSWMIYIWKSCTVVLPLQRLENCCSNENVSRSRKRW